MLTGLRKRIAVVFLTMIAAVALCAVFAITAHAAGTYTITVTDDADTDHSENYNSYVINADTYEVIDLEDMNFFMDVGDTGTVTVTADGGAATPTVTYAMVDGNTEEVYYAGHSSQYITVDANGKFKALKATFGSVPAYLRVTVNGHDFDFSLYISGSSDEDSGYEEVYRLYNKNTGEHLFTRSENEYDTLQQRGWTGEYGAWYAPTQATSQGSGYGVFVWRLYNRSTGEHLYTSDTNEINTWLSRNVGWTRDDASSGFYAYSTAYSYGVGVTRLYNGGLPGVAQHLLTLDQNEINELTSQNGYGNEGTKFKVQSPY